jgi:hypothetical protein
MLYSMSSMVFYEFFAPTAVRSIAKAGFTRVDSRFRGNDMTFERVSGAATRAAPRPLVQAAQVEHEHGKKDYHHRTGQHPAGQP